MSTAEKPTLELKELNKFLGSWRTEGKIPASPSTAEVKIHGTDTYEWLPGEFFLLHKADVMKGEDRSETFEVIGYDPWIGKYTMQHYDNKGQSGYMTATCEKDVWMFLGDTLRFTGSFKKMDTEFSGIWEQLTEGKWVHFMDISLTRVQ
jgi:hypothetical protein